MPLAGIRFPGGHLDMPRQGVILVTCTTTSRRHTQLRGRPHCPALICRAVDLVFKMPLSGPLGGGGGTAQGLFPNQDKPLSKHEAVCLR